MSKNVYVFAEQRDGEIQKVAFELIGKGKELAETLGHKVVAVLLGFNIKDKAETLIQHGADEVVVVDSEFLEEYMTEPYAKAMFQIIKNDDPEIVMIGATAIGRDLAPRLSARVHTGLTADCTALDIDPESKNLLMTRPAFGGNVMATIVCENYRPQMATVRPGVMVALEENSSLTGEIREVEVSFTVQDRNVKIREVIKNTRKSADITEAQYLVSGGRGMGSKEAYGILYELAEVLGGEVSSSRAGVDSGWQEKDRQVGQTGKTVRPELYLACGISGAIQHIAGMDNSELIIAINKNDTAPIFDVADIGIVGDLHAIVPKLTEAIKKYKAENQVK